ncbi:MAG: ABC transporter ATP-binding protein [Planctomycetota bacterium]|jgi:molybdopterin-binding protein
MLSVEGVSKTFESFCVKDVSFEVGPGQYFVLLGASGVGKSIVLETIAGLIEADSGRIFLDGEDITDEQIQRRRIGLVFQDNALFGHMTVFDNIAYPLRCRKLGRAQIRERVGELAEQVGMEGFLRSGVGTLSGGEIQRVSLARALASEPRCLLLDEPLSSLDAQARADMRSLLRRLNEQGQTIVHVTHDYTEAVSLATHIGVMEGGSIAQVGTVEDIFAHPKSEFVARFVGISNYFKGRLERCSELVTKTKQFVTDGVIFRVLTESADGYGYVCIGSEDVTISNERIASSARNNFNGTIVEVIPVGSGMEVTVDIGVRLSALVTVESVKALGLECGKTIWVSFKASAVRFIEQ